MQPEPEKIVESLLESPEDDEIKDMALSVPLSHRWRYYSYDLWGNAEHGWEVNNVFSTPDVYDIPDGLPTDEALFQHLRTVGFFSSRHKSFDFDTEGDDETIYLNYRDKPIGELRRLEPEEEA